MSDTHHTDSKDEQPKYADLMKSLGCVWSEENEAWVHSKYGMGFTSQIEPELLNSILTAEVRKARIDELEGLPLDNRGAGGIWVTMSLEEMEARIEALKAERNGRSDA